MITFSTDFQDTANYMTGGLELIMMPSLTEIRKTVGEDSRWEDDID